MKCADLHHQIQIEESQSPTRNSAALDPVQGGQLYSFPLPAESGLFLGHSTGKMWSVRIEIRTRINYSSYYGNVNARQAYIMASFRRELALH